MNEPFWETKQLAEMNRQEWEALCDGCGHCCLVKLEDEDSGDIYVTNVNCHLLDVETCRCQDYQHRQQKVDMCLLLGPDRMELMKWLPEHCAYRLLDEAKQLRPWHPLISGDPESVHRAGISVRHFAQSEEYIHEDQLEDHILHKL